MDIEYRDERSHLPAPNFGVGADMIRSFHGVFSTYSGEMKFTFYDHFGLDANDLTADHFGISPEYMGPFRQWYILQHWIDLEVPNSRLLPKPYVAVISYTVPFEGAF